MISVLVAVAKNLNNAMESLLNLSVVSTAMQSSRKVEWLVNTIKDSTPERNVWLWVKFVSLK